MAGRRNYALALFSAIGAGLLGLTLAPTIPSSVFPELVFPRSLILAESGDLPPEQMQVAVARPLEEAAYGVPGVSSVRSTTTRGSAEIDVTFASGADPVSSFQLLTAALGELRGRLPADTKVDSRLLTTGSFPILDLSLSSKVRSLPELTDIATFDLVPGLHRIPGVFRVELVGAKYREYVVRLDPERMAAHNLSPNQVVSALSSANVISSAGRLNDSHRMILEVVSSDLTNRENLEAIALTNVAGQPVHVRDIGSVELGVREDYIRAASENGPSVLVGITRQAQGNTEQIAAETRAIVAEMRHRYPDVSFSFSYDQSALVRESFNSVRDAIVLGLILAVAVVYLFTRSAISALIAMVVVPACILSTFAVMKVAGLTFNMMTLGGLAAGIGLFIDDAIVMIEAIHRHRAAGAEISEAIGSAVEELRRPLVGSTLTVMVVLVPLVFLSGVTGTFFRALATTLGAGLAISLALALYVTPALELMLERWRRQARPAGPLFDSVRKSYDRSLQPFIRRPGLALAGAAASAVAAAAFYHFVGTDYLPQLDEGAFIIDYQTPPQSTLADTDSILHQIEAILRSTPEVVAFARRVGTQLGFFLTESNTGDMSIRLAPNRSRDVYEIMDSVRGRIERAVPGVRIEFTQLLEDLIGDLSGLPQPVEIKVFGADQAQIEATAQRVAAELKQIPGLVDVFSGIVLSNPEEQVSIDATAAERYQLSPDDVKTALHAAVAGSVATSVRVGDRLFDVRVRYPDVFHQDLGALPEVMLNAPGGRVPLTAVTNIRWLGERSELARERLLPVIHVTARLSNLDLGTAISLAKSRLARLNLPPGVSLEYGGLYADQQTAFRELTLVLCAGVVAVLLVLLWEFGSARPSAATLVGALTCVAGSFLALTLTGITLNISSFMGLIMVVGIAAKNGVLLLDQADHEIRSGLSPGDAILAAARIRIRPILMTTIATVAGLFPLAMGLGAGARVQQPLAVVVIGGLVFSMLFSIPLAGGAYLFRHQGALPEAEPLA